MECEVNFKISHLVFLISRRYFVKNLLVRIWEKSTVAYFKIRTMTAFASNFNVGYQVSELNKTTSSFFWFYPKRVYVVNFNIIRGIVKIF
jgi:hypothetical protein